MAALLAPASKAVRIASSFSSLMAWGRPPPFPAPFGGGQPSLDAFLRQSTFVLGECPKHTEQERTLWRSGIHPLGQGAKGHAPRVQGHDNVQGRDNL